jgi:small GTP-binding protein
VRGRDAAGGVCRERGHGCAVAWNARRAMASGPRATVHCKLVLLGNAGVGKSCLVQRFVRKEFNADAEPTIGGACRRRRGVFFWEVGRIGARRGACCAAAFITQSISLDAVTVKMEIWDTAGQERYRSLAPMYYRGAQAAVVVFSLVDRGSFDGAKVWVKELQRRADPGIVIALAGNKSDLLTSTPRAVERDEAAEYAADQGLTYIETSAKADAGVTELFHKIAELVPKRDNRAAEPPSLFDDSTEQKKAGCCSS